MNDIIFSTRILRVIAIARDVWKKGSTSGSI